VAALGIDVGIIKYASLVLLLFFGLVMLSGKLSEKFSRLTQGAANFGNKLQQKGADSYKLSDCSHDTNTQCDN
jgi:hypothetical protein